MRPEWPSTVDCGKCGISRVGNGDGLGDCVGHGAQPGAEDDGYARAELAELGSEIRGCFRYLVVVGHGLPEEVL